MPQYDIRLYSSQLLLFHEDYIAHKLGLLTWTFPLSLGLKGNDQPDVGRGVLVTIETDDRHFSSGSEFKYPFAVQFSFMMLFLMHKCLINNKKAMEFGLMSLLTKQSLWLVYGRSMLNSMLINSLYRPKWPVEYRYIIVYITTTNKFLL